MLFKSPKKFTIVYKIEKYNECKKIQIISSKSQSPEKLTDLLEREKITIKETTKKHALIYTLTISNKLVGHK